MNNNIVVFKRKQLAPNFEDILKLLFFSTKCFITNNNDKNKQDDGRPRNEKEKDIYNKHVCVDKQVAINICRASLNQSSCPDWFLFRRLRITASKAHLLLHGRKLETRQKYFLDFQSNKSTLATIPACDYGIQMEDEARIKFMKVTSQRVYQCGK